MVRAAVDGAGNDRKRKNGAAKNTLFASLTEQEMQALAARVNKKHFQRWSVLPVSALLELAGSRHLR